LPVRPAESAFRLFALLGGVIRAAHRVTGSSRPRGKGKTGGTMTFRAKPTEGAR